MEMEGRYWVCLHKHVMFGLECILHFCSCFCCFPLKRIWKKCSNSSVQFFFSLWLLDAFAGLHSDWDHPPCLDRDLQFALGNAGMQLEGQDHVPQRGEGRNHRCVVCSWKHYRYAKDFPGKLSEGANPFKRSKTMNRCRACHVYLCAPHLKPCWDTWHSHRLGLSQTLEGPEETGIS